MTGQLDVRARVEVDASRAVSPLRLTRDELKRTTEAMRESATTATAASRQTVAALERQGQAAAAAARQLTSAAGSTRAAYQQLGFQISDVAAQASAGVRPLQIFAQQGGQVAFALSQFGGGLGRVGAFLAGPWGAALLAGGLALSAFLERTRTAEDGVNALSAALDRLAERKLSAGQQRAEDIGLVQIELARLEGRAAALQTRAEGPATGGRRGVQARILARQELAAVETEIAGLQAVLRVQEQVAAAVDRAKRAQEAGAAAARAAGAAAQEAARRAATAAREAARAEAERVRQHEALARAAREAGAALQRVIPSSLIEAFEIGQRRQRGFTFADDPLREAVGGIEARRSAADRLEEARQLGAQQAREASREMLRQAGAIGAAIGGRAGRTLSQLAGLAEGVATGDFSGAGRAGGIIGLIGNAGSIIKGVSGIFKAAGAALKGLASGATSLGAAAGPIGAAVASAVSIGKVVASLFKPSQRGKVTLTGAGGDVVVGPTGGNSADRRAAAEDIAGAFAQSLARIAEQLGASIGQFAVTVGVRNDRFTVDPSGRNLTRGAGVMSFGSADQALAAALADALRDGAITGVSTAVQAALRRYASDVNRALAEALKVQELEQLLAARDNPFLQPFRDFERQARERLKVARDYGFDLVEIERLNGEERKRLVEQTLAQTVRSARDLLNELRFGSRAEGSPLDRLRAAGAERERLQRLFDAGDLSVADALARIIEQQLDVAREAFGTAGGFAGIRGEALSTLERIVQQTERRIAEASLEAQRQTVEKLAEANASLDDQVALSQAMLAELQRIGAVGPGGVGGFDLAGLFQRVPV